MIYINGQAVAPTYKAKKLNLLENETIHSGGNSFSYGNVFNPSAANNAYYFGLVNVEVGKAYDLTMPPVVNWGMQWFDSENKGRFNTGFITLPKITFVATQPKIFIVFNVLLGEYTNYAAQCLLTESDYELEELPISFNAEDWEKGGLSYSNGRTFADAKNTNTGLFRFKTLIETDKKPFVYINTANLNCAVQGYDDEEKGRADSGWMTYYGNKPIWTSNIALVGQSSDTVENIVNKLNGNFHIYIVKGVK